MITTYRMPPPPPISFLFLFLVCTVLAVLVSR